MDAGVERLALVAVGAVLGFALGRTFEVAGPPAPVAEATAAAAADPGKNPRNPRLAAAGRKGIAASGMNSERVRCTTCGLETTRGPMTGHLRASGHEGTIKADA